VGTRLLPAFRTSTGIPYGTVNLLRGVPKGETELASTAGAGSLLLEFEVLSCLSGDPKFGLVAMRAAEQLFHRRSELDLVGKHIHIRSGKWHETLSGVGSNSDSFYEYLLKSYLLFQRVEHYRMFQTLYRGAKRHSLVGDWFVDVDMFSGQLRNKRSENLQAFWPGMEAVLGMSHASARLLNAFYLVWTEVGFLPEEFDYSGWGKGASGTAAGSPGEQQQQQGAQGGGGGGGFVSLLYPLRPELIESTYLHYRTTGDRSWLEAGRVFMESLETHSRTECGYATVKDVTKRELEDSMPSFFLSETLKYLFLLFDEDHFLHTSRDHIFTTEAHPLDPVQLAGLCPAHLLAGAVAGTVAGGDQDPLLPLSGQQQRKEGEAQWGDSLLGRVFSSLTGGGGTEELQEEGEEEMDVTSSSLEQEDDDEEVSEPWGDEVVTLDSSDQRRRAEALSYSDWSYGRELHPHYLQCPKPLWWTTLSYRPGISVASSVPAPAPAPEGEGEAKTRFLDLSEFLRLLSQQPFVDPFVSTSLCGVDDDLATATAAPASSSAQKSLPSTGAGAGAVQKVAPERSLEVEVGGLGTFAVSIFTDGFVIQSRLFGNTLEIAGVGSPTLFVKEHNATTSSSVIATGSSLSTCHVRLEVDWGRGDGNEGQPPLWKKRGFNSRDFSPEELAKNRYPLSLPSSLLTLPPSLSCCSHAAFGPTADPKRFPRTPLSAPATRAVDGTGCQTPPRPSPSTLAGPEGEDETDPVAPVASSSSWFSWGGKRRAQQQAQQQAPYAGSVVIAERGACMFEEKVIQAEAAGAAAVIVVNSEVPLLSPPPSRPLVRRPTSS
jgi:hypothetical protein